MSWISDLVGAIANALRGPKPKPIPYGRPHDWTPFRRNAKNEVITVPEYCCHCGTKRDELDMIADVRMCPGPKIVREQS